LVSRSRERRSAAKNTVARIGKMDARPVFLSDVSKAGLDYNLNIKKDTHKVFIYNIHAHRAAPAPGGHVPDARGSENHSQEK